MRPISKFLALAAMASMTTPALAAVRPAMTPLATTGKAFSLKRGSAAQGEAAAVGGGLFGSATTIVVGIIVTVVVVTSVVIISDEGGDNPTSN